MTRTPFSRRRFLQLSGGLALAGVSLPLWAHDMADMAGGDAHPALRLPQPYKIKGWRSTKARYASRPGRRRRAAEDIQ
ncbi:nitrate/sulfonate/bicarbonate ABC transporter periplasmic protein [Klebsiella pneumoniae]|uniref:Nitrate/sulfonate/bicarbonate ABC transporter periplasmic protein n=1 Tax=Klebsiella pneumoniae TaxID=573 RepID=A0A377X7H9_KLEPN|nr:nitrate/sulfonate/bicarbonate ABC transporter periplasmic protein [Klebsiella pneumoniae]